MFCIDLLEPALSPPCFHTAVELDFAGGSILRIGLPHLSKSSGGQRRNEKIANIQGLADFTTHVQGLPIVQRARAPWGTKRSQKALLATCHVVAPIGLHGQGLDLRRTD